MKAIEWWSDAGFVGTERRGVIHVEDDATEDDIEAQVKDEVFNFFEWGWDQKPPKST